MSIDRKCPFSFLSRYFMQSCRILPVEVLFLTCTMVACESVIFASPIFAQQKYLLKTLNGYSNSVKFIKFEQNSESLLGASRCELMIWSSVGSLLSQKKLMCRTLLKLPYFKLTDAVYVQGLVCFSWWGYIKMFLDDNYDSSLFGGFNLWDITSKNTFTLFHEKIKGAFKKENGLENVTAVASSQLKDVVAVASVYHQRTKNGDVYTSSIRIFDLGSRSEINRIDFNGGIVSMKFNASGNLLAIADRNKYVALISADDGITLWERSGHNKKVTSVTLDDMHVASGGDDKAIILWHTQSGSELRRFIGHTNDVRDVAISPDGSYIASASKDKTVRIWELQSGMEIILLRSHKKGVNTVSFSPDGNFLASGSDDKTLKLWDFHKIRNDHEYRIRQKFEMPADLQLAAYFTDSTSFIPNANLDAGESAQLLIRVKNNGEGIGFDV